MRKGFTLIELLAVIVILAIIALIATPLILNVIDDSKKSAFKNTAYGIIEAAELEHSKNLLKGNNVEVTFTYVNGVESSSIGERKLDYKGTKPRSGEVTINTEGMIAIAIHDGKYCVKKGFNEDEVNISEKESEDCFVAYMDQSGASYPEISNVMIPVKWNEGKWVKANVRQKWYDYDKQEWANVVLVTEGTRNSYKNAAPGTEISAADVLAYLVWIPRYRYKLFNVSVALSSPQEIEIKFEHNDMTPSIGSNNDEWLTHPAFTFGNDKINGFWVGKFETSGNAITPTVKPGVVTFRGQTLSEQFNTAQEFNNVSKYGITSAYDAHMMKNMEWGAVAYLSHSKYGKYGNSMYSGANKEIYQNKSNGYITGSSNGTPSQEQLNTQCPYDDIIDRGNGLGACGAGASTTGNIYGIYDMSGGAWEYVVGGMYNSDNTTIMIFSSGFNQTFIDSVETEKYIDKYAYGTSSGVFNRRQLGDATGETREWYGDIAYFVHSNNPWFVRGGFREAGTSVGIFYFNDGGGDPGGTGGTFRLVVTNIDI